MAKARRTTHRSTAGKKLYAVRDTGGRFKDIQTYERAHRADLKRSSQQEVTAKARKAAAAEAEAPAATVAKKTAKQTAGAAKTTVKKAAKKR